MQLADTTNPWGIKSLTMAELIENYQELPQDLVDLAQLVITAAIKEGEQ